MAKPALGTVGCRFLSDRPATKAVVFGRFHADPSSAKREREMTAYFVAEIEVTNPERYAPYAAMAGATLAQYGGKSIVRGGKVELVEGSPEPKRIVITEFADAEAALRWYNSPEYQAALPIRLANSRGRVFIVEGA
jgi:uncharacterized protein (DUF1330 family)